MASVPDELKSIPAEVLGLLTAEVARSFKVLPVRLNGKKLVVALADAKDLRVLRAVEFASEREIEPLIVPADLLDVMIRHHYAAPRPAAGAAPRAAAPAPAPPPAPAPSPEVPASSALDDFALDDLAAGLEGLETTTMATEAMTSKVVPQPAGGKGLPPPVQKSVEIETESIDPARLERALPQAIALLSADTARNFHVCPIDADQKTITVAFAGAVDLKALRAVQYATQRRVIAVLAPREALEQAVLRHYPIKAPAGPAPRAGRPGPVLDPRLLEDRDPEVIALLTPQAARKYRAVPIEKLGRRLSVAMENPDDFEGVRDLEFVASLTIKALRCDPEALAAAIERYYPPEAMKQAEALLAGAESDLLDTVEVIDEDQVEAEARQKVDQALIHDLEAGAGDEAPAVKLCNMLIKEAVGRNASDIHIETYEHIVRVRYRVDGQLYEVAHPAREMRNALLSRIKVIAGMNIAENRMPQDGRIKMRMKAGDRVKAIDLRVSVLPTIWGEKVAIRILDPDRLELDLSKLGLEPDPLARFHRAIAKPYGMCLVVGPSGCGKTNTLYSAMAAVNTSEVNIMTAEDPVEFNLRGINQVQTDEGVGLTFAASLRSFLRQDPNIILVGEIRDFETAEIAVKASLTGHLVLSTLHTTDAPTTISRLINMGIEPFLIANSLLLISAQRLVRKICEHCKAPDPRPEEELYDLGYLPDDLPVVPMKGQGCRECHMRGTKGRTAVFEVLDIDDDIRELVMRGATPVEIKNAAREKGMLTLRDSGLRKIKAGISPVEEITRETIL